MKAIRRAVAFALHLIGASPTRSLEQRDQKDQKDQKSGEVSSKKAKSNSSPNNLTDDLSEHGSGDSIDEFSESGFDEDSKLQSSGADKRAPSEVQRYEYLPVSLETRVQLDRGWLHCLVSADGWQALAKLEESDRKDAELSANQLCSRLFDLVSHFSNDYNVLAAANSKIGLTPPFDVSEKIKKGKNIAAIETTESISYRRWRASTSSWSLTGRTRGGTIEIYLVPAPDVMMLSGAEAPIRMKLRLDLRKIGGHFLWTCDGLPVSAEELRVLLRFAFRDLVSSTQDQAQPSQTGALIGSLDDAKLARSLEQLLAERENLAQKVVIQQEEIQKRIARDLHDAVISDVMAIKRNLASGKAMPRDISEALDLVVQKLREICYDLSPRDLSDWGLSTVVEDMLEQMAQRTGADCSLNCDIDVPVMPSAVQLHIYRIIQESLNNAEKYARPSKVIVTMEMNGSQLAVLIADNGQGFDLNESDKPSSRSGGYGMGSLRERADLIRCFYPARLDLQSAPGKGTRVRLEIDLSRFH